jgi:cupin fold WbuC family metalloprotein
MSDILKKLRSESAEVLYAGEGVVTVDAATITALVQDALRNPRGRIRLCTHTGTQDAIHEMMIVHDRSCYVRPHKHVGKSESFHVIEGKVDVVLLDDGGMVTDVISMGAYQSGLPFFYRIAEPIFHTLLIRSDVLVFHETTAGPFRRDETIFAPWAPAGDRAVEIGCYVENLEKSIAEVNRSK